MTPVLNDETSHSPSRPRRGAVEFGLLTMTWMIASTLLTQTADGGRRSSSEFPAKLVAGSVRVMNAATRVDGTGAVVGRVGPVAYVLTAAHLVEGERDLRVSELGAAAQGQPLLVADVIAAKAAVGLDLAILRVSDPAKRFSACLPIADGSTNRAASPVRSIGSSDGKPSVRVEPSVEFVLVRKNDAIFRFWKSASAAESGRSGGALVDRDGKLLGICSGSHRDFGYFVHAAEIQELLKQSGLGDLKQSASPTP
jgi:S1-C subfamily serine protease